MSAIRFAKNLPQEDHTRYDQISSDQGGDEIREFREKTSEDGQTWKT
jgi:hypothetical protein